MIYVFRCDSFFLLIQIGNLEHQNNEGKEEEYDNFSFKAMFNNNINIINNFKIHNYKSDMLAEPHEYKNDVDVDLDKDFYVIISIIKIEN